MPGYSKGIQAFSNWDFLQGNTVDFGVQLVGSTLYVAILNGPSPNIVAFQYDQLPANVKPYIDFASVKPIHVTPEAAPAGRRLDVITQGASAKRKG